MPHELLQTLSNIMGANSPVYRQWTNEDRLKLLQWYKDMGQIIVVEDPERGPGNIQRDLSFCLVRFLPDIRSGSIPYFSDASGDIVYIDYVYKGSNKGYLCMFIEGVKRWAPKTQVAFHREDRPDGSYSLLPINFCVRFCKTLV